MYVCVCHALRERDVEQAVRQGVRRPAELYQRFGVTVQCGRCVPCIRELMAERRAAAGDWAMAAAD